MKRVTLILALLLLLAACGGTATPSPSPTAAPMTSTKTSGPYEVTITALPDPAVPRRLTFTFEVKGGPDEDAAFACPVTHLSYGDGGGIVGDPVTAFGKPCPEERGKTPRHLTFSHTYQKAGTYTFSYSQAAIGADGVGGQLQVTVR